MVTLSSKVTVRKIGRILSAVLEKLYEKMRKNCDDEIVGSRSFHSFGTTVDSLLGEIEYFCLFAVLTFTFADED